MVNSKLGFGPMSREIIDSIFEYADNKNEQLMIIASRNQIDTKTVGGGYVSSTESFFDYIKNKNRENVLICRDHCGPYFSENEKNMSLRDAVEETKKTIASDIEMGFDLIHIDTSKCHNKEYETASELFEFSTKINPNIMFEFGSEENVGVSASLEKYQKDVSFASSFSNKIEFVVGQTGSLVYEDKQVGTFDRNITEKLSQKAEENGVKFKEHNADYLNSEEVGLRKLCGVNAVNIAPEFGVIQTKLLYLMSKDTPEWYNFCDVVVKSKKWSKWIPENSDNIRKVFVAGHYLFNSDEYKRLIDTMDYGGFIKELKTRLFGRFDTYSLGMK